MKIDLDHISINLIVEICKIKKIWARNNMYCFVFKTFRDILSSNVYLFTNGNTYLYIWFSYTCMHIFSLLILTDCQRRKENWNIIRILIIHNIRYPTLRDISMHEQAETNAKWPIAKSVYVKFQTTFVMNNP